MAIKIKGDMVQNKNSLPWLKEKNCHGVKYEFAMGETNRNAMVIKRKSCHGQK